MAKVEGRWCSIRSTHPDLDLPRSVFSSKMKTADKIRFGIHFARYCFHGLGSTPHTENILSLFDLMKEIMCDRFSIDHVREVLIPRYVKIIVEREGLFPIVENTITIHQLYHILVNLPRIGPLRQSWMFVFERLNHHIRSLVKNKAEPITSIVKNLRVLESSVQFLCLDFHNMARIIREQQGLSSCIYFQSMIKALESFHIDLSEDEPTIYLPLTNRIIDLRGRSINLTISSSVQDGILQYCVTNSVEGQYTLIFKFVIDHYNFSIISIRFSPTRTTCTFQS